MNHTTRTEVRRLPKRGSRDWQTIQQILDTGFLAHVGFCVEGQPFVIPTLYGREDQKLYMHGSSASRMLRQHYRSVVAFGIARKIEDSDTKLHALRIISDQVISGRWEDVRQPTSQELKATTVLEFVIEEASSKIRTGPPLDDDEDYALPVWAGVLPLAMNSLPPIADPRLAEGVNVPDYIRESYTPTNPDTKF